MRTIDSSNPILITQTKSTATLLGKVLWITTLGFIFTAIGAYIGPETMGVSSIAIFILWIALLFGVQYAARRNATLGLVLFYVFTLVAGAYIAPLLNMYLHLANGQSIVFEAACTTALGMAVMAIIAQIASFNYQRVASYAFGALLGLLVIGLISTFVHIISPTTYSWIALVIFSVFLLCDFMRLRDAPANASPVSLALSIYLDSLNIFLFLLQIFSGRGSNRARN